MQVCLNICKFEFPGAIHILPSQSWLSSTSNTITSNINNSTNNNINNNNTIGNGGGGGGGGGTTSNPRPPHGNGHSKI